MYQICQQSFALVAAYFLTKRICCLTRMSSLLFCVAWYKWQDPWYQIDKLGEYLLELQWIEQINSGLVTIVSLFIEFRRRRTIRYHST